MNAKVVAGTSAARETTRDVDFIFRLRGGRINTKRVTKAPRIRRRPTILSPEKGVFRYYYLCELSGEMFDVFDV